MQFTVAVTTRNRADSLAATLNALARQDFAPADMEVIVADNGSADDTAEVAERARSGFANFHYLRDDRPGQLVGWHRALALAGGEIACFIDDDVRPRPGWLAALAEAFADSAVGLATGPIVPAFETVPPDWLDAMRLGAPGEETLPFLGLLDAGPSPRELPGNFVWGSNFVVRRELVVAVGGFHPCAMPWPLIRFHGDGEIHVGRSVEGLGRRVLYHPEAAVEHAMPAARLTLEAVYAKFTAAGIARSYQHLRQIRQPYDPPAADEIAAIAARYFRDPAAAPAEALDAVRRGLGNGIAMHLAAFTEDAAFRDWVLRDDYLDLDAAYVHPDLAPLPEETADWRHGGAGA